MSRESCIKHNPDDLKIVVISPYFEIVSEFIDAAIVGIYHFDGFSPKTLNMLSQRMFGIKSEKTIKRSLKRLEQMDLLSKVFITPVEAEVELLQKNLKGFGVGYKECQWCGIKTIAIEEHHYPIPACKGGTETVSICPTCHSEYHRMTDAPSWVPTSKLITFLSAIEIPGDAL